MRIMRGPFSIWERALPRWQPSQPSHMRKAIRRIIKAEDIKTD
jgi:hypothetical protein